MEINSNEIIQLVIKTRNNEPYAFEELYNATLNYAYGISSLYLNNYEDIQDALQNSYMYVSKSIKDLKNPESFLLWLRVIVKNEAFKILNRNKKETDNIVSDFDIDSVAFPLDNSHFSDFSDRVDVVETIRDSIKGLSNKKRLCVVLFYFEGKSITEISAELGIPEGTVKSRLHSAKNKLEKELSKVIDKNKLYGVSFVPFVGSVLAYSVANSVAPFNIQAGTAAAIGISAAGTTAAAATVSAATATTATTAAATTAAVTGAGGTAVAVKAVAVVAAVTVTAGGTAVVKNYVENHELNNINRTINQETIISSPDDGYSVVSVEQLSITPQSAVAEVTTVRVDEETTAVSVLKTEKNTAAAAVSTAVQSASSEAETETVMSQTQYTVLFEEYEPSVNIIQTTIPPTTIQQTTTQVQTTVPPTTIPQPIFESSGGILKDYVGSNDEMEIPHEINGSEVTAIGVGAFSGNTEITSVTIPDTVIKIGQEAFSDCSNLTEVIFPSSLETVGIGAFYGCSGLTSVSLPDGTISIGDDAFAECTSLTEIYIPFSVTEIGDFAFDGCDNLVISCQEGSMAHSYALEYGIDYILI